jgi:hypothetical protein
LRSTTCTGWPACSAWIYANCSRPTRSLGSDDVPDSVSWHAPLVVLRDLLGFHPRRWQPSTQADGEARRWGGQGGGRRRSGACCLPMRVGAGDTVAGPDRLRGVRAVVGASRPAADNRRAVAGASTTGTRRRGRDGSAGHGDRRPPRTVPSIRRAASSNSSVPALDGRGASVGRRHWQGRRARTRAARAAT